MTADVWKDCLICGKHGSALRLHQSVPLSMVTDGGHGYIFCPPDEPGALALWYHCLIDEDDERDGCGVLYSALHDRTGDTAEAEAALIVGALMSDSS